MNKKIQHLKIQLTTAIFALIVVLISGFFVFGPDLVQIAQALNPTDYNKGATDQLTATDWNRLDDDFVDQSGDTMTGGLTVPNINVGNIDISGSCTGSGCSGGGSMIEDESGTQMRMVCGKTAPGATGWESYAPDPHSVRVNEINTQAAGFSSTPQYIVNLSGSMTYVTIGFNNVYGADADSFRIYAVYLGENNDYRTPAGTFITPEQAEAWQWTVNWCAIGY